MTDRLTEKTYGLFEHPLNKKLIEEFEKKGADYILFPNIETQSLPNEQINGILKRLKDFDWIVFTDIFTVEYFFQELEESNIDAFELDELTICAYGEAVADRLRFRQIHADVIPSKLNDEKLFSTVSQFAVELQGTKFLTLVENPGIDGFSEKLRSEKAIVEEIAVYESFFENDASNSKFNALIKGGAIDEFVFSAPENLLSLKKILGEGDFSQISGEINVSATSEMIYQTLQEHGFRPLYFHFK